MKKRIMSILLCLILALGMLPAVAFADSGTLQLSQVIVNEAETVIEDDKTAFTFTIKANDAGNDYYKTIDVTGGSIKELTDLPAGSYTITQTQQTGYTICAISGAAETNYNKDYYVINVNEGTDNPVVTFINTRLAEMSSVSIKKTATDLPNGTDYPNPTVSIYAVDENGSKLDNEAIWTGTLTANGDTLYIKPLFKSGTYIVEETGADVTDYDYATTLSVKENGADVQCNGITFTVGEKPKTYSLTVENQYKSALPEDATVDIMVQKVWNDDEYKLMRPDKITVRLLANGRKVDAMTLTADDEGQWVGAFIEKPVADETGEIITYTVAEDVPENYTVEYTRETGDIVNWTIINTYDPGPEPVQVKLIAMKTMDGDVPAASAFTFELKNDAEQVVQTVENNENGMILFEELFFEEAGTYTYTMSEVAGDDTSIAYDSSVYTAKIEVELNTDGNYEATVVYEKDGQPYVMTDSDESIPVFENTTKPGALVVSKTVSGGGADKTKAFTFTVTLSENGDIVNGEYGGVTFTDGAAAFTLTDGQSKTISGLPAGFSYTVAESDNSGYTVKVNNTDETTASGTIEAAKTAIVTFDNYKAKDPEPAEVTLNAVKTLDGAAPTDNSFTFTLKDEKGSIVQTKTNDGGQITFDSLSFSSVGTYRYTMEEAAGTDSTITYDKAVYTVIINVTKSDDYQATVTYEKDGTAYSETPVFANTTVKNTISVSVNKVWKDNESDSRPDCVTVQLYCDGKAYGDAVTLNKDNNWSFTWNELDEDCTWTVDEVNVPDGYTRSVTHSGNNWTITNSKPLDQVPHTGDSSDNTLWLSLACLSAAGLLIAIVDRKRLNSRQG